MSDDDGELRRGMEQLGGSPPDVAAGLVAVRHGVRRAWRRRIVGWSVAGVAAIAALIVVAANADRDTRRPAVTVPTLVTSPRMPMASSTTSTTTTDVAVAPTPGPADTAPETAVTPSPRGAPRTTVPQSGGGPAATNPNPPSAPPPVAATTVPQPPGTEAQETDPQSTSPPSTAGAVTSTFAGTGGSITVRASGGRLTLLASNPRPGFVAELQEEDEERRVEVRFSSNDHETQIRVDLIDGRMVPEIDEHGGGSSDG